MEFLSFLCHSHGKWYRVVYNHWTGMVEWNCGIANSAKMRSKGHNIWWIQVDAGNKFNGAECTNLKWPVGYNHCRKQPHFCIVLFLGRFLECIASYHVLKRGYCIGNCTPTCDRGQSEVKRSRRNFEVCQVVKQGIGGSLGTVKVSPGNQ